MAFITIPSSAIEVGRAIKKSLFTLIKDNFDDHESRLNLVEAGVEGVLPLVFNVNGNYDLMLTIEIGNIEQLKAYISHPIHKAFSNKIKPFVSHKVKFDYTEQI